MRDLRPDQASEQQLKVMTTPRTAPVESPRERTERPAGTEVRPLRESRDARESREPRAEQRPAAASAPVSAPRWEKKIKAEETLEDIHRDNERIEKEIWLEIASIHTIKLDF